MKNISVFLGLVALVAACSAPATAPTVGTTDRQSNTECRTGYFVSSGRDSVCVEEQ